MRTEIVNTWELAQGDLIATNGTIMRCGPFEDEVSKWGATPTHDLKGARWCRAVVIDSEHTSIPPTWFDTDADGNRTWLIQGNTNARWCRILEDEQ